MNDFIEWILVVVVIIIAAPFALLYWLYKLFLVLCKQPSLVFYPFFRRQYCVVALVANIDNYHVCNNDWRFQSAKNKDQFLKLWKYRIAKQNVGKTFSFGQETPVNIRPSLITYYYPFKPTEKTIERLKRNVLQTVADDHKKSGAGLCFEPILMYVTKTKVRAFKEFMEYGFQDCDVKSWNSEFVGTFLQWDDDDEPIYESLDVHPLTDNYYDKERMEVIVNPYEMYYN